MPSCQHTRRARRRLAGSCSVAAIAIGGIAIAPSAQAEVRPDGSVTVIARNLDNPRGLAVGPGGDLYVAEAGHGGAVCLPPGPEGPLCAGLTSALSKVSHGQVTRVAEGLFSAASPDGSFAEGLVAVSTQGDDVYGQFALHSQVMPPDAPAGPVVTAAREQLGRTIAVKRNGSWSAVASTGDANFAWTGDHKQLQPDQFPDANPNGLDTKGDVQYVADAGANLIAKVSENGRVSTVAYLQVPAGSPTDAVPTCVATAPDGSLYVGELLGGDFAPGHARVWRIADGRAKVKWTGFTGIQGCGFDNRGNFYATEFQANGMFGPDSSGAVVKVTPNGTRTMLGVGSLNFPSGFAFKDGAVYVSNWSVMPASKGGGPTGEVVKISVRD